MTDGSTAAVTTTTGDLWDAAKRLRTVRRAHERFLGLWALDRLLDAPAACARVRADVDGGPGDPSDNTARPAGSDRSFFRLGHLDD